jgi:hypothetical protein
MNNTSNTLNTTKRGRGRPRKETSSKIGNKADADIPMLVEPNMHDMQDELDRMDSYTYSRYNE